MKYLLLLLSLVFVQQSNSQTSLQPVKTVPFVNLQKYLGTWYEIAAIPQSFQKKCIKNTRAEYALVENGLISVINSCDTISGERSTANGRAKVVDTLTNSKLKVTFVNIFGWQFLFGGDYWILSLGENYSYSIVGSSSRDYAWILSRTPELPPSLLREANSALLEQGFDTCKLISTPQTEGLQEKTALCNLITEK